MYTLSNDSLSVSILDPVNDRNRLGSRYCTGCSIRQVTDILRGDLLSGPQYPDEPEPFHGQGAPDAFETALGQDLAKVGEEVLVIGVGRVKRTSPVSPFHVRDNPEVVEFCQWSAERTDSALQMETVQQFGEQALKLTRTVELVGRQVRLNSRLWNTGSDAIHLRWFAHPFFPLTPDFRCCKVFADVKIRDNPGFEIGSDGFLRMKKNHDWGQGWYQPLEFQWGSPAHLTQAHPIITQGIEISCAFPCAWMPVWANDRTFSFEPYIDLDVRPGKSIEWAITFRF